MTSERSGCPSGITTISDDLSQISAPRIPLHGEGFSPIQDKQNWWEATSESDGAEEVDAESYLGHRYAPAPTGCEDFELYIRGGLHPMLMWTTFANRYTIVHKLGAGGSATVWLARDHVKEQYDALKIFAASRSEAAEKEAANYQKLLDKMGEDFSQKYLLPLYDIFWFKGPNGKHLCISMGVAGPSLASLHECPCQKLRADIVNSVAAEILSLSRLHAAIFVCGDLSSSNIAFTLQNLDDYSYEELLDNLGEAGKIRMTTALAYDIMPNDMHHSMRIIRYLSSVEMRLH